MIEWYKAINNKDKHTFITFDVCEFYPSITKELVQKALDFAANFNAITEEEKHTILHTKKALLYDNDKPWTKRTNSDFDVTMGSYDGAETCELVGLYILSQLSKLNINIGLYRDDGLAVCRKTPRQAERIKKEICKIFTENNLKITVEANQNTTNFLDITMDMQTGEYKPYMKPNNRPLYIHKEGNHPPSIIKNIPENINKRLTAISSNEAVFKKAAPIYQEALQRSGYTYELKYQPSTNINKHQKAKEERKRHRNITWFNPPYNKQVSTNIGRQFLTLIEKYFPPENKLHKIINKNTIKISYSCTRNMKQTVSSHNKQMTQNSETQNENKNCNCRNPETCPLDGHCLTTGVIYQATVTRLDNDKEETYVGLTAGNFKTRFNLHTSSFRNNNRKSATTLSRYIWDLKDKEIQFRIGWKILAKSNPYSPATNRCNLCLREKYFIIFHPHASSLNSRNELTSSCRHRKRFLLEN